MIAPDFLLARQLGTASGSAGTVVPPRSGPSTLSARAISPVKRRSRQKRCDESGAYNWRIVANSRDTAFEEVSLDHDPSEGHFGDGKLAFPRSVDLSRCNLWTDYRSR